MYYPVALFKEEGEPYEVFIPDLKGCHTCGQTINEALKMAHEAIHYHLNGCLEVGQEIPLPSSIENHMQNPEYKDAVLWSPIEINLSKIESKSARINISIPIFILSSIDLFAKEHHKTRSRLLCEAALKYMEEHK